MKLSNVDWIKLIGTLSTVGLVALVQPLAVAIDALVPARHYGVIIVGVAAVVAAGATALYSFIKASQNQPVPTNTITVTDNKTGLETTIATVNPPGVTSAPTPASGKGT